MRLLFAGTPDTAVPSLQALHESSHEVCAVLTRPDAAAGRGRRLVRSPIAEHADALGIPVLTPTSLRDTEFLEQLANLRLDCCPVVAYGALIPPAALVVPTHGWVNLHFSLLPAWRGASPVQYAILNGDQVTGATTFRLDEGLDTGDIFGRIEVPIDANDTSGVLLERLATSGAELLVATIDGLAAGSLTPIPQSGSGVSYAPKIEANDARIDWSASAEAIDRRVRACTPAPGAWTTFRGDRIKVSPVALDDTLGLAPGRIVARKDEVIVGTGTTAIALSEVRPEGRKAMAAADWARGVRLDESEVLR